MTVFKSFFKVARRYLGAVALYVGIMALMSMIVSSTLNQGAGELAVDTQGYRIAVINHDQGDPLSQALVDFLGSKSQLVELEDQDRAIREALFWREALYVLRLPQGFGQAVLRGENPGIEGILSPNDYVHLYADSYINRFLSTFTAYHSQMPEASMQQLLQRTTEDLTEEVQIKRLRDEQEAAGLVYLGWYMRYLSYSLLAAVSTGMGMVLSRMMDKRLQQRNRASSLRDLSRNLQLALASLLYASLIWLVLVVAGALITRVSLQDLLHPRALLMLGISYLFMGVCMGIALLVSAFTQNRQVISGVSNVLSLGSSFLSGVFVPLELLGPGVAALGRALPAYWYTLGIRVLADGNYNGGPLPEDYRMALLILLLMMAVLLAASALVQRSRRQLGA